MEKILQMSLIIFAVISVALGDVAIKKATESLDMYQTFTNKWFYVGVLLYITQIFLFAWMFVKKWDLSVVGILQTVFYAAVILLFGYFMFGEKLNNIQLVGVALAAVSVFLITYAR